MCMHSISHLCKADIVDDGFTSKENVAIFVQYNEEPIKGLCVCERERERERESTSAWISTCTSVRA